MSGRIVCASVFNQLTNIGTITILGNRGESGLEVTDNLEKHLLSVPALDIAMLVHLSNNLLELASLYYYEVKR